MKRVMASAFVAAAVAAAVLSAQSPRARDGEGARDLRLLVTVGGHSFEHKAFYGMLDAGSVVLTLSQTIPADFLPATFSIEVSVPDGGTSDAGAVAADKSYFALGCSSTGSVPAVALVIGLLAQRRRRRGVRST